MAASPRRPEAQIRVVNRNNTDVITLAVYIPSEQNLQIEAESLRTEYGRLEGDGHAGGSAGTRIPVLTGMKSVFKTARKLSVGGVEYRHQHRVEAYRGLSSSERWGKKPNNPNNQGNLVVCLRTHLINVNLLSDPCWPRSS